MTPIITQEMAIQIDHILNVLLNRAEARAAFLCDTGGNIYGQAEHSEYADVDNIIALAAGAFFATREMARMLGEAEFLDIIHRGHDTSVAMQSMGSDFLLIIVFGIETNPGIVKFHGNETGRVLAEIIAAPPGDTLQTEAMPGMRFEIDQTAPVFALNTSAPSS